MPAVFNLELNPGQFIALDTLISSDELDMARMEDGTTVDGQFWGKLNIVHDGDTHEVEFTGTRIINSDEISPDMLIDSRVISKLAVAARAAVARCNLSIMAPTTQYCDITLNFSPYWKIGVCWHQAEISGNKVIYTNTRVRPGGAIEHFDSETIASALYYEAM